jgi:hypothetical protein
VSDSAALLPNHDCVTGACLPSVPDRSFNVFASCGGV